MTKPLSDERLTEIRERLEKTTPGEWVSVREKENSEDERVVIAPASEQQHLFYLHPSSNVTEHLQNKRFILMLYPSGDILVDNAREITAVEGCGDFRSAVKPEDADFIANSKQDVAALLQEVERLREENKDH